MQTLIPYFNTVGRVLISAIFLLSGISKVSAYAATQGYMAAMGELGDQTQFIMFMKNIAIAGGFLFLVANGPGALALDNRNAS